MSKMAKCVNCLKGAKLSITGTNRKTLKLDMGGAAVYVIPHGKGIDVHINSESLVDGNYAVALWNDQDWIISSSNERKTRTNHE